MGVDSPQGETGRKMNIKLLSRLNIGETGRIIMIRGKAEIHRYLLGLGLTVGRDVAVEKNSVNQRYSPVIVKIGEDMHTLHKRIASHVKVEII